MATKSKAQTTYEYYRKRLLKEAERGGLTTQEARLIKIVEKAPNELNKSQIQQKAYKLKAEFKRIRKTKKYKAERKIRNIFYKELGKFQKEELRREARARLMNLPPRADQMQSAYFKQVKLNKLMQEGITRRIDNKIVRYKGVEAVEKQIESLRRANNPEYKKKQFIETYITNLEINGVPEEYVSKNIIVKNEITGEPENKVFRPIEEMRAFLESCDPKEITYLLDKGYIRSIEIYYVWDDNDTEHFVRMLDLLQGSNRWKWERDFKQAYAEEEAMAKIIKKEKKLKEKTESTIKVHNNFSDIS